MHEVQQWRQVVTRSLPGTFVLVMALLTHIALALYKLANRSTLRLPAWELIQIGLGLLIPFLLFPHIVNTRIAHVFFGVEDNYLYELARLWPDSALLQSTLLLLVWVHGCIGLHFWLRLYPPYRAAAAGAAVRRHRRAAGRARRLHGVGPRRGAARSRTRRCWPGQGADQLAERRRRRMLALATGHGAARLCRRPAAGRAACIAWRYYVLSTRPKMAITLYRRADRAGCRTGRRCSRSAACTASRTPPCAAGARAARPAGCASTRAAGSLTPPGYPGSDHARQHRRAGERASRLPGAARAAR